MTTPAITSAEIAALRALAEKATPGPWFPVITGFRRDHPTVDDVHGRRVCTVGCKDTAWQDFWDDDAAFIASARDALPRAADTIAAQAAEIAALRAENDRNQTGSGLDRLRHKQV